VTFRVISEAVFDKRYHLRRAVFLKVSRRGCDTWSDRVVRRDTSFVARIVFLWGRDETRRVRARKVPRLVTQTCGALNIYFFAGEIRASRAEWYACILRGCRWPENHMAVFLSSCFVGKSPPDNYANGTRDVCWKCRENSSRDCASRISPRCFFSLRCRSLTATRS
jgi:hypothetical protein